jgi:hypothetical protein
MRSPRDGRPGISPSNTLKGRTTRTRSGQRADGALDRGRRTFRRRLDDWGGGVRNAHERMGWPAPPWFACDVSRPEADEPRQFVN